MSRRASAVKRTYVESSDDEAGVESDASVEFEQKNTEAKPSANKQSAKRRKTTTNTKKSPAKSTKSSTKKATPTKGKETKKKPTKKKAGAGKPKAGKVKELKLVDKLDMAMKSYKWWEAEELAKGVQWRTLEHMGVCFAEPYEPHGVKMLYEGQPVDLTPEQEELATFYAAIPLDGPQLGDPKVAPTFQKNFFKDFRQLLGRQHIVKKFEKCDFSDIRDHLKRKTEERKNMSKEEKEIKKEENQAVALKYGYAIIDGHIEKVGAYKIEPPGLFRGRGVHPKTGTLKRRVIPEEVTINIAELGAVPPCPIPGHNWKRVVHDPTVTWLAYWKENVMGNTKYVFLAASSSFKGKSDRGKYEKARRLKQCIHVVREHYENALKSSDEFQRQCGTAMWVIDRLALRVGGEKDEDEADTVGCCSLRVEHLTFAEGAEGDKKKMEDAAAVECHTQSAEGGHHHCVTFDFLGKDSMRYYQTIDFDRYGPTGVLVYNNIKKFCKKKKPEQDVFDKLTPTSLNNELQNLMPGLSAKVFRTYNASVTLEQELPWSMDISKTWQEKKLAYDRANREVAILCNHQRTPPKTFQQTFEKLQNRVEMTRKQCSDLKKWVSKRKKNEEIPLRGEVLTGKNLTDKQKLEKQKKSHMFAKQPSVDQLQKRLKTFQQRLAKLEIDMRNKDENKQVALGTSKINYMDPRITVAWCKAVECPIEKIFARTLRDKFPWAMGAATSFKF